MWGENVVMSFLKNLFKYGWYTKSEFKMKDSRIVFEHADTKENFKIHFFFIAFTLLFANLFL